MRGYPYEPGWKGQETSRAAAEMVAATAPTMLARIEEDLAINGPATPEEITARIAKPGERVLLTSIRSRVSQLRQLGLVVNTGDYGRGDSGKCRVVRVRLTTGEERSHWAAQRALEAEKGPEQ